MTVVLMPRRLFTGTAGPRPAAVPMLSWVSSYRVAPMVLDCLVGSQTRELTLPPTPIVTEPMTRPRNEALPLDGVVMHVLGICECAFP